MLTQFFQIIILRKLLLLSALLNIFSVKPLCHGFAMRPVSGRSKTTPTPTGAGRLFPFAYSNVYLHFVKSHTWRITLISWRFCGWVFFPIGGGAGESQVSPSAAPSWGKNTAAVSGVHGWRSSSHIRPFTYRVIRRFANANYKQKAVLYSAVLGNGVRNSSSSRMGAQFVHAKNNRHHR